MLKRKNLLQRIIKYYLILKFILTYGFLLYKMFPNWHKVISIHKGILVKPISPILTEIIKSYKHKLLYK